MRSSFPVGGPISAAHPRGLRRPRFQSKQRRIIMRIAGGPVFAATLTAAPLAAYAATTSGDISHIDRASNSLVLDNGSSFHTPTRAELSRLRPGEKVAVAYVMHHGTLDARDQTHELQRE